jgi:hypothetical protein
LFLFKIVPSWWLCPSIKIYHPLIWFSNKSGIKSRIGYISIRFLKIDVDLYKVHLFKL